MYESGRETSIRGIVVTILLIILVICVLIWIFPTKKDIKGISGADNEVLLSEIFSRNLRVLQNAGRAYYYSATVPKNVGDSTKTTLNELIEKKMLLELKDKSGKTCDGKKSYVQLTKKSSTQYELKSYLECGKESNYILDNLGCSNLKSNCKSTTTTTTKTSNTKTQEKTNTTTNTTNNTTTTQPTTTTNNVPTVSYYYRYLYSCPKTTTTYSDWSAWSTTYVSASNNRIVDTKVEYENQYVKTGTKQEPVVTYVVENVSETIEEEKSYVNYKPDGVENCITVPRSGYTLYQCKEETVRTVSKTVPKTTYNTVDEYGWKSTPVTYYRYKTLLTNNSSYEFWSTDYNNASYKNMGCSIIKSEKVAQ